MDRGPFIGIDLVGPEWPQWAGMEPLYTDVVRAGPALVRSPTGDTCSPAGPVPDHPLEEVTPRPSEVIFGSSGSPACELCAHGFLECVDDATFTSHVYDDQLTSRVEIRRRNPPNHVCPYRAAVR